MATFCSVAGENRFCDLGSDKLIASPWYGPNQDKQHCNSTMVDQLYRCSTGFVTDMQMKLTRGYLSVSQGHASCTCKHIIFVAGNCNGNSPLLENITEAQAYDPSLRRETASSPNGFTFLQLEYTEYVNTILGIGNINETAMLASHTCPGSTRLMGFQTQTDRSDETIRAIRFLCDDVKCAGMSGLACLSTEVVTLIGVTSGVAITGIVIIMGFFIKALLDKRLERFKLQTELYQSTRED